VVGYRIFDGACSRGSECPYYPVGTVEGVQSTSFVVTGLENGVTRYYAVAAVDQAGNESRLSEDEVFDTPRPAGTGAVLNNADLRNDGVGFDFSAYGTPGMVRDWNDPRTDIYYTRSGGVALMVVPSLATGGIQDMGYASSLDAVDYAPTSGWSPTGSVEPIVGHDYVLWTSVDPASVHYAKFRVSALTQDVVVFDWAYQVDPSNRELRLRPAGNGE
jgi:hypothetical protein